MTINFVRFDHAKSSSSELFIFPHAGGIPGNYRQLACELQEFISVRIQSRPDRSKSLNDLIDDSVEVILKSTCPSIILFGHSFGAIIAWEVARKLEQKSKKVLSIVISGMRYPTRENLKRIDISKLNSDLALYLNRLGLDENTKNIFVNSMNEELRLIQGYVFDEEYRTQTPVQLLYFEDDQLVEPKDILSWRQNCEGGSYVSILPGDHLSLVFQSGAIEKISEIINDKLLT